MISTYLLIIFYLIAPNIRAQCTDFDYPIFFGDDTSDWEVMAVEASVTLTGSSAMYAGGKYGDFSTGSIDPWIAMITDKDNFWVYQIDLSGQYLGALAAFEVDYVAGLLTESSNYLQMIIIEYPTDPALISIHIYKDIMNTQEVLVTPNILFARDDQRVHVAFKNNNDDFAWMKLRIINGFLADETEDSLTQAGWLGGQIECISESTDNSYIGLGGWFIDSANEYNALFIGSKQGNYDPYFGVQVRVLDGSSAELQYSFKTTRQINRDYMFSAAQRTGVGDILMLYAEGGYSNINDYEDFFIGTGTSEYIALKIYIAGNFEAYLWAFDVTLQRAVMFCLFPTPDARNYYYMHYSGFISDNGWSVQDAVIYDATDGYFGGTTLNAQDTGLTIDVDFPRYRGYVMAYNLAKTEFVFTYDSTTQYTFKVSPEYSTLVRADDDQDNTVASGLQWEDSYEQSITVTPCPALTCIPYYDLTPGGVTITPNVFSDQEEWLTFTQFTSQYASFTEDSTCYDSTDFVYTISAYESVTPTTQTLYPVIDTLDSNLIDTETSDATYVGVWDVTVTGTLTDPLGVLTIDGSTTFQLTLLDCSTGYLTPTNINEAYNQYLVSDPQEDLTYNAFPLTCVCASLLSYYPITYTMTSTQTLADGTVVVRNDWPTLDDANLELEIYTTDDNDEGVWDITIYGEISPYISPVSFTYTLNVISCALATFDTPTSPPDYFYITDGSTLQIFIDFFTWTPTQCSYTFDYTHYQKNGSDTPDFMTFYDDQPSYLLFTVSTNDTGYVLPDDDNNGSPDWYEIVLRAEISDDFNTAYELDFRIQLDEPYIPIYPNTPPFYENHVPLLISVTYGNPTIYDFGSIKDLENHGVAVTYEITIVNSTIGMEEWDMTLDFINFDSENDILIVGPVQYENLGNYQITITLEDDYIVPESRTYVIDIHVYEDEWEYEWVYEEPAPYCDHMEYDFEVIRYNETMYDIEQFSYVYAPQIWFDSISWTGEIKFNFERRMQVPRNWDYYINNNTEVMVVEIFNTDHVQLDEGIDYTWNMTDFTPWYFTIQLYFDDQTLISSSMLDTVYIEIIDECLFIDEDYNRAIDPYLDWYIYLPKQLDLSDPFTNALYNTLQTSAFNWILPSLLGLSLFLSASLGPGLGHSWATINVFQLVMNLPILNSYTPANVLFTDKSLFESHQLYFLEDTFVGRFSKWISRVFFKLDIEEFEGNLISMEIITDDEDEQRLLQEDNQNLFFEPASESVMFTITDDDKFINFFLLGYESEQMVVNLSVKKLFVYFFVVVAFALLVIKGLDQVTKKGYLDKKVHGKVIQVEKWINRYLLWNPVIALVHILALEVLIMSFLDINTFEKGDEGNQWENKISRLLCWFLIFFYLFYPFYLGLEIKKKNFRSIERGNKSSMISFIRKTEPSKFWWVWYMVRRIFYVFTVFGIKQMIVQVQCLIVFSVLSLCFLVHSLPFRTFWLNFHEIYNETGYLLILYHFLYLSPITDEYVQTKYIGTSIIVITILLLLQGLYLIFQHIRYSLKYLKMKYNATILGCMIKYKKGKLNKKTLKDLIVLKDPPESPKQDMGPPQKHHKFRHRNIAYGSKTRSTLDDLGKNEGVVIKQEKKQGNIVVQKLDNGEQKVMKAKFRHRQDDHNNHKWGDQVQFIVDKKEKPDSDDSSLERQHESSLDNNVNANYKSNLSLGPSRINKVGNFIEPNSTQYSNYNLTNLGNYAELNQPYVVNTQNIVDYKLQELNDSLAIDRQNRIDNNISKIYLDEGLIRRKQDPLLIQVQQENLSNQDAGYGLSEGEDAYQLAQQRTAYKVQPSMIGRYGNEDQLTRINSIEASLRNTNKKRNPSLIRQYLTSKTHEELMVADHQDNANNFSNLENIQDNDSHLLGHKPQTRSNRTSQYEIQIQQQDKQDYGSHQLDKNKKKFRRR